MYKIKVNDLPQVIMDRLGLVLYNSLFDLLHPSPERAPHVFKSVLILALNKYEEQYPLQLIKTLPAGNSWTFTSNFDKYLAGDIDEKYIQLIPTEIYYLKSTVAKNSQWWRYNPETAVLTCRSNTPLSTVEYCTKYPYVIEIAPDHRFTEDSYIYFLDIVKDTTFLDYLAYYIIRQIKLVQNSIQLGTNAQFLPNLDSLYSELEAQVTYHKEVRSKILRMWRK